MQPTVLMMEFLQLPATPGTVLVQVVLGVVQVLAGLSLVVLVRAPKAQVVMRNLISIRAS
jgi:hypothetical protein